MFDETVYDYYLSEPEVWYEGDLDEDGHEIYYFPCTGYVAESIVDDVLCSTKRHTVRVQMREEISTNTKVEIVLPNIRNPETLEGLVYYIAVMRERVGANIWGAAVDYYIVEHEFEFRPDALIHLLDVQLTPSSAATANSTNALRGRANYALRFSLF